VYVDYYFYVGSDYAALSACCCSIVLSVINKWCRRFSVSDIINSRLETVIITMMTFWMSVREVERMGLELRQVSGGVVVAVFVKPNSRQFQLKVEGETLVALCRESPVRGRVNKELIRELSRIFKKRVEIVAGLTSRQKKILITSVNIDEAARILSMYVSK